MWLIHFNYIGKFGAVNDFALLHFFAECKSNDQNFCVVCWGFRSSEQTLVRNAQSIRPARKLNSYSKFYSCAFLPSVWYVSALMF